MLNALQTGRTAPKCRVQHCIVCDTEVCLFCVRQLQPQSPLSSISSNNARDDAFYAPLRMQPPAREPRERSRYTQVQSANQQHRPQHRTGAGTAPMCRCILGASIARRGILGGTLLGDGLYVWVLRNRGEGSWKNSPEPVEPIMGS